MRYKMPKKSRKIKTSVALDERLIEWIDEQVETRRFASRTHAVEYALEQLRNQLKGQKP